MIAIVTLLASFLRLTTAQQPGVIQPLAEACGPKTANIICINHYAAVMPSHFGRNALAWEQFEEDSIRTMTINDSSFTSLVPSADFIIFDKQRAFEILGDSPTFDFIFNVSNNYHEAPVYVPTSNKIYNAQLQPPGFLPLYAIDLNKDPVTLESLELYPLYAPNDAQYVNGSIYWAVAGSNSSIGNPPREQHSGIYKTDPTTGDTVCLLNSYFGYYFNCPNDIAVHKTAKKSQLTPSGSLPLPPLHRRRQHRLRIPPNGQRHRILPQPKNSLPNRQRRRRPPQPHQSNPRQPSRRLQQHRPPHRLRLRRRRRGLPHEPAADLPGAEPGGGWHEGGQERVYSRNVGVCGGCI